LMAILVRSAKGLGNWALPMPALRWPRLKPILKLCAQDYPNRASNYFASWGDKLVLGATSQLANLDYRNASRLPDALREMLFPLAGTSLPSFSRDFHHSQEKFRENVLFSGATVFFAGCLLMVVPTGFAEPLLKLWLGDFAPGEGEIVMILMGVFQAFQLYLSVMGYAFFAAAKRQLFIPQTVGKAILSLVLTLPAYRLGGISGIALMNAALGLVQVIGLWFLLRAIGFEVKATLSHATRILATLGVCLALVAGGSWISGMGLLTDFPVASLVFAPAFVLLAMCTVVQLGLARLPDRMARRIPKLLRPMLDRSSASSP